MRTCLVVCATKQQTACQVAGQIANALFAPGPCAGGQQAYDRSWNRLIKILRRLGWLDPVRIEVFSDRDLPTETASCPDGEQSRIAQWCRGLTVSMHLSDRETPRQPGIS